MLSIRQFEEILQCQISHFPRLDRHILRNITIEALQTTYLSRFYLSPLSFIPFEGSKWGFMFIQIIWHQDNKPLNPVLLVERVWHLQSRIEWAPDDQHHNSIMGLHCSQLRPPPATYQILLLLCHFLFVYRHRLLATRRAFNKLSRSEQFTTCKPLSQESGIWSQCALSRYSCEMKGVRLCLNLVIAKVPFSFTFSIFLSSDLKHS